MQTTFQNLKVGDTFYLMKDRGLHSEAQKDHIIEKYTKGGQKLATNSKGLPILLPPSIPVFKLLKAETGHLSKDWDEINKQLEDEYNSKYYEIAENIDNQ